MEALDKMTVHDAARAIYDFSRENAKQDFIYGAGDALDPDVSDYPTNKWTCNGKIIDFDGLKLKVTANFECPTNDDVEMCDEECVFIEARYVYGNDEQLIMFDKYHSVLEYELEKIAGDIIVIVDFEKQL